MYAKRIDSLRDPPAGGRGLFRAARTAVLAGTMAVTAAGTTALGLTVGCTARAPAAALARTGKIAAAGCRHNGSLILASQIGHMFFLLSNRLIYLLGTRAFRQARPRYSNMGITPLSEESPISVHVGLIPKSYDSQRNSAASDIGCDLLHIRERPAGVPKAGGRGRFQKTDANLPARLVALPVCRHDELQFKVGDVRSRHSPSPVLTDKGYFEVPAQVFWQEEAQAAEQAPLQWPVQELEQLTQTKDEEPEQSPVQLVQ